jgi:threonine/homoserine/homoserine lactone efflux protein
LKAAPYYLQPVGPAKRQGGADVLASGLLVFGAALLVTATPGPGSFYVPARTLAGGAGEGLASSLGIAVGGLVHVMAGAAGVAALILASPQAFTALKWAGAAYLFWLGLKMYREAQAQEPAIVMTAAGVRRAFRDGVVMEALNPKTAAFFLAFIPGFIDPAQNVALQFVFFGLLTVLAGAIVDVTVTLAAASARGVLVRRPAAMVRIRQAAGAIVCGLAALLLFA